MGTTLDVLREQERQVLAPGEELIAAARGRNTAGAFDVGFPIVRINDQVLPEDLLVAISAQRLFFWRSTLRGQPKGFIVAADLADIRYPSLKGQVVSFTVGGFGVKILVGKRGERRLFHEALLAHVPPPW